MHLHSAIESFDGKEKGNGHELTIQYPQEDHPTPSSNSIEETNGTIIIASPTITCLLVPPFQKVAQNWSNNISFNLNWGEVTTEKSPDLRRRDN